MCLISLVRFSKSHENSHVGVTSRVLFTMISNTSLIVVFSWLKSSALEVAVSAYDDKFREDPKVNLSIVISSPGSLHLSSPLIATL